MDRGPDGLTWVIQPRRVAARAAATYVAAIRREAPGDQVGWHVRFEPRFSDHTRLLYVTDGIAVRRIQEDPFLDRVTTVIFDELHERSVDSDIALAMLRRVQAEVRPDLRLILMSATVDAAAIAAAVGDAPRVQLEGRSFPIEIRWDQVPHTRSPIDRCASAIRQALDAEGGDILVFLPGVREIERVRADLNDLTHVSIVNLHGGLSLEAQTHALRSRPERRVVLSTNIAETSVTLDGIRTVIDTGLAKIARHDATSGLATLGTERISRASADQRAGRAGRTAPGLAVRLWTERDHLSRPAFETPEIERTDLASLVLQLRAWGESDVSSLPWLTPLPAAALAEAEDTLHRLQLLDRHGLTDRGREVAKLPVHPRLGVLLLSTLEQGIADAGALAAAVLSGRDPFHGSNQPSDATECDVYERVLAVRRGNDPRLRSRESIVEVKRAAAQLLRLLPTRPSSSRHDEASSLRRAIAAGWPDRLTQRRAALSERGVLASGRGVKQAPSSGVRIAALYTSLVIDDGPKAEGIVRLASAVDEEWIDAVRETDVRYDAALHGVVARETRRAGAIVLSQRPVPLPADVDATPLLLNAIQQDPREIDADGEVEAWRARLSLLHRTCPELALPDDQDLLEQALASWLQGRTHLRDLTGRALIEHAQSRWDWSQRRDLDTHAPTHLTVPSGRQHALTYRSDGPPVLAVRMQELFGLTHTPTIAKGRCRVLLHLLAPNGRVQQVTDDLAGFWSGTWADVRKELRARYPKHDWPEDPARAIPRSGPKPRRRS
jgi:ATP-dependent helicase HrpB